MFIEIHPNQDRGGPVGLTPMIRSRFWETLSEPESQKYFGIIKISPKFGQHETDSGQDV